MSAPDNAKPLMAENPKTEGGADALPDLKKIKVQCSCGFRGHVGELLVVDDEETMWCPQCRTIGWTYR